MKKYRYLLFALLPVSLWAQEETGDEVKSVEIRVVEDYKAQVRAAHKISEQPSFADTTSVKIPVVVRIQPKAMVIDFSPETIPAIRLGRVQLPKLPTQKVSLGAGNYSSSYADFVLSSPRSKKNVWGVNVHHEGARKGVRGSDYALQPVYENNALIDYQRATRDWNFKSQALFDANYFSYYGLPLVGAEPLDSVPGAWNLRAGLNQQWLKTANPTTKVPLTYRSGGLSYLYSHAGIGASEHLLKTAHRLVLYADKSTVNIDLGYQLGALKTYADSAAQYHHFYFNPKTAGKNGVLNYEFGLTFAGTAMQGDSSSFSYFIFPNINLQAEVLKRTLAVYGGWDGHATQQTLSDLSVQLPQITATGALPISGENRGYVGMQGALVGKLQYRVEGTLAFVSNGLQFERDSANSTQWVNGKELAVLQASYSSYNRTGVRAELNMPIQNFTLSAYTAMNAYGGQDQFVGSEGSIWGALVRFDRKELHATTNLKYVGARYNGTANGQVYALEDYLDWNIDLGYEINDNLSVSLKAYNLLNQEYQLFSGYKVRGTRGLFVLNYQF